jgi:hypothetical protein
LNNSSGDSGVSDVFDASTTVIAPIIARATPKRSRCNYDVRSTSGKKMEPYRAKPLMEQQWCEEAIRYKSKLGKREIMYTDRTKN